MDKGYWLLGYRCELGLGSVLIVRGLGALFMSCILELLLQYDCYIENLSHLCLNNSGLCHKVHAIMEFYASGSGDAGRLATRYDTRSNVCKKNSCPPSPGRHLRYQLCFPKTA